MNFSATPSYEDCFFGKVKVREEEESEFTLGSADFVPKYPFFANLRWFIERIIFALRRIAARSIN